MPELPEVETVRRGLADLIVGQTIEDLNLVFYKSLVPVSQPELVAGSKAGELGPVPDALKTIVEEAVIGASLSGLRRRGKVLILELDNGYSLVVHLKMTGQLVFDEASGARFAGGHPTDSITSELPDSSTRLIFEFASGDRLYFNDQRKFGWVKLVKSSKVKSEKLIANMGPEPFGQEFTADYLKEQLQNRTIAIKAALLDQKLVAGVGNIYADEALHKAKIHPETPANELNDEQLEDLIVAIPAVMQTSLDHGGTTFTNYVDAHGKTGDYLGNARVYQQEGEACLECGTKIEKIKVANRGTHICPECQK